MAVAAGYTVLAPRTFSKEAWENVRAAGIKPAGQVTPSPKPYSADGVPMTIIPREKWSPAMLVTADHCEAIVEGLVGHKVTVRIVKEFDWPVAATYGPLGELTLNYTRLGGNWFEVAPLKPHHVELLLHEAAHDRVLDHLSSQFADEIARLGAKLAYGILLGDEALRRRFELR